METTTEHAAATPAQAIPHARAHRYTNPIAVYAVLALSTLIEVGITVLPGIPHAQIVPVLLALSFVKAGLVALYYMHLRYEKLIYGLIFVTPAAFAIFLLAVLLS